MEIELYGQLDGSLLNSWAETLRMNESEFQQLCSLYETRLRLLKNPVCVRCDAKIRNPLAVWHVGSEFRASKIRLLFVGKPHRGKPGIIRPSGLIDPRERVKELRHMSWPYWN